MATTASSRPAPEPTKLTFGSAARACKTNRVRQESGPDGGGPASGPSGGETGIEMPEMTPGRKDLGALLQGFGLSQHVKGGWATSLLTDAFLPRILTSFSLCGCSRTAIRRRDLTGSAVQSYGACFFSHNLKNSSRQGAL